MQVKDYVRENPAFRENRPKNAPKDAPQREQQEPRGKYRSNPTPPETKAERKPFRPFRRIEEMDAETKLRWRRLFGFTLGIFGLFLAVAFASHLFTGRADQSIVEYGPAPARDFGDRPANAGGTLGAFLSNVFITNGYGLVALLLPPYLLLLSYALLQDTQWRLARRLGLYLFLTVNWVSFALGFVSALFSLAWPDLGGAVGLALTDWVSFYLGFTGVGLLLALAAGAFVLLELNPRLGWAGFLGKLLDPQVVVPRQDNPKNEAEAARQTKASEPPADEFAEEEGEESDDLLEGAFVLSVKKLVAEPEPTVDPLIHFDGRDYGPKKPQNTNGNLELVIQPTTPRLEVQPNALNPQIDPIEDNIYQVDEGLYNKIIPPEDLEALDEDEIVGSWEAYDPTLELSHYKYPPIELLKQYENPNGYEVNRAELEANKNKIVRTLQNYSIEIASIKATIGPTVTLYEIVPAPGVRISKIQGLEKDIALRLAALGIRIIAPMPGLGTIGIEIPNSDPDIVSFRSLVATEKFRDTKADLPIAIGKTISNEVYIFDLAKMPHLLVAGATGQGKSVGLNCIIASLLYKKHPAEIKFVLIDPKKVEMTLYQLLEKHFLAQLPNYPDAIITDNQQVIHVLSSLCMEMDQRYDLLKLARVRNIKEYNAKFTGRRLSPRRGHRYLPFIVVIIDELADLMMTAGKEVEAPIARLAQLARAVGIHLVVATQRPSVNVITGTIKANFPARLSYRVTSNIDSRTILGTNGAEQLIGRGDMLLSIGTELIRMQNAFVDTPEVESLVDFIANQPGYPTAYYLPEVAVEGMEENEEAYAADELDPLFEEAARLIVRAQQGSTSLIQRRMSIGYNRAGRVMDQLEKTGVVGQASGSKPRDVLIYTEAELDRFLVSLNK